MKLVIGSDHGGYTMKKEIIEHFQKRGIEIVDVGTDSPESCDYPVYAKKLTDILTAGEADLGILICGTGIGMSMAANKVDGIRAALCHDVFSAEATRSHNNANVLCAGLACMIADTFVDTPFSNDERHIRRISMYSKL